MICACFGHHDAPIEIYDSIKSELLFLIDFGYSHFYIGHQGSFDRMVRVALCAIQQDQPHVRYSIVLAYMPGAQGSLPFKDQNTIFPEELAGVPPRCAISRRNQWMIDRADYVLLYAVHPFGGTGKAMAYARRKRKLFSNVADDPHLPAADA